MDLKRFLSHRDETLRKLRKRLTMRLCIMMNLCYRQRVYCFTCLNPQGLFLKSVSVLSAERYLVLVTEQLHIVRITVEQGTWKAKQGFAGILMLIVIGIWMGSVL